MRLDHTANLSFQERLSPGMSWTKPQNQCFYFPGLLWKIVLCFVEFVFWKREVHTMCTQCVLGQWIASWPTSIDKEQSRTFLCKSTQLSVDSFMTHLNRLEFYCATQAHWLNAWKCHSTYRVAKNTLKWKKNPQILIWGTKMSPFLPKFLNF